MINRSNKSIVIIDDEIEILSSMELFLESEGFNDIYKFSSGNPALDFISNNSVDLLFLDLNLPDISGQDILTQVNSEKPNLPVIVVTGYNDLETAISIMKQGAYDYLVKPIDLDRVSVSINNALKYGELNSSFNILKKEFFIENLDHPEVFSSIITANKKMIKLFHYISAISISSFPVLITGETGVGKELFAKAIHDKSNRPGDFIAMDVSSYSSETFKDALFGHVKGAYTGALGHRDGLIKAADSGTLFLDEIGDLNLELQSILLRVLQESEYRQSGSDKLLKTNARIIFATNRDLKKLIQEGRFRKDLYYRLETHNFNIPPLRDRSDDISLLFSHFISEACENLNREGLLIPEDVYLYLKQYNFPGNVRELKNIALNSATLSSGSELNIDFIKDKIEIDEINSLTPNRYGSLIINTPFPTFQEAELILIDEAMERTKHNQIHAAALLGISRQALNKRLNKINDDNS